MAGEGSSGFTSHNPHGHCTSVQTHLLWLCCAHTVLLHRTLLGHSLHLGARHILQCSICCSRSLFQRCAFLHIKMQKCSFLSHQLLIAIIKWDMQPQERPELSSTGGWFFSQLSRRLSASWKYPFCLTTRGWASLSIRNVSCAYLSSQDLPQGVGSPRQEIAQQYRWCNSHTASGFGSEIWAILTGERRQIKELIWAKTDLFSPTRLILTWIHLWIRFAVRLHKHFCWHRGSSRKEQAPGRDRKGNKGFWQDCWLLTTQSAHGTIM